MSDATQSRRCGHAFGPSLGVSYRMLNVTTRSGVAAIRAGESATIGAGERQLAAIVTTRIANDAMRCGVRKCMGMKGSKGLKCSRVGRGGQPLLPPITFWVV